MTDDEALKVILQAAYGRLRADVVLGLSRSADESSKLREVALRTLDQLRARVVADPAWLDRIIAQVPKPDRAKHD